MLIWRLSDCVRSCGSTFKTYVHIFENEIQTTNSKNFVSKTLSMFDAYRIQTIERKSEKEMLDVEISELVVNISLY